MLDINTWKARVKFNKKKEEKKHPNPKKKTVLKGVRGLTLSDLGTRVVLEFNFRGGGTGGKENEQTQPFLRLPKTP